MVKYLSLFAGIGGFEVALERNGHTPVGYSEINKYCCQVMKYHFKEVVNYGDATKIDPDKLPEFDLLVGGFPCQAFSVAGKRRGFQDTRGTLFFDIARILKAKKPSYFILENVKGLLNHDKGNTFRVILNTLWELGYDIEWLVLNSRYFGVPQNRERVYIVGYFRERCPRKIFLVRRDDEEGKDISKSGLTKMYVVGNNRKSEYSSGRIYLPNGIAPTLMTDGAVQITDGFRIRKLTPKECERLQGLPDDWTAYGIDEDGNKVVISDTQRYKMTGNAVTVNVVDWIVKKLFKRE